MRYYTSAVSLLGQDADTAASLLSQDADADNYVKIMKQMRLVMS